ncbi:MAG TPA: RNA polymerase factor sigma-54, partial [Chitinophagales bacterium]|nr:RNA polymerase factor sigma-54 [Chitinophagales bacterium]
MLNQQQTQSQKQLLKFLPQQIQLLNLLRLTSMQLEQHIQSELEENPALEEGKEQDEDEQQDEYAEDYNESDRDEKGEDERNADDEFSYEDFADDDFIPDYKTQGTPASRDEEVVSLPAVQRTSFRDGLKEQVKLLNLEYLQRELCLFLIDSLDDDGYLHTPLEQIIDDYSFSSRQYIPEEEFLAALMVVQACEPAGIGARTLQECLLLQINRKKHLEPAMQHAHYLIENYFNEISKRNFDKISQDSGLGESEIREALQSLTQLAPKPVTESTAAFEATQTILPDFLLNEDEGKLVVLLTNPSTFELRINRRYMEMSENFQGGEKLKRDQRSTMQFVKQKINSARWFIDAIKQREHTLLKTVQTIVDLQEDYFRTGDIQTLKPMILKDVAKKTGFDNSTISRVTSTKHIQTPHGIIPLKQLFSSSLKKEDGEEFTNKAVQEFITEM